MEKIKIIQISSASHSLTMKDYEKDIFVSWYARVAFQLKKFYPDLEIECWTPERKYKTGREKEKEGVKFRIFPTNFSIRHGIEVSFPIIKALEQEIKKCKREKKKLILHLHEYHSLLVYMMLLMINKKNIKIIAQHHGGRSPTKNMKKHRKLVWLFPLIKILQFLENLSIKKIDLFYALSDEEMGYLKNKVNENKIKFQTMGIDEEYFKRISKNKARKKLKLSKKKYALYIGRIKKTKGIWELIEAARKLPEVEFLLIGEGPDYEIYKDYIRDNKIQNIKFSGLIYGEKKLLYLSACDCLVLPSYTEGAPVVLMEAIARNLPVVATDVGGVRKMIENRREGIIINVKSSEEIIKALKEVFTWEKKDIKKYAEKYKWKKIIEKTVEDYFS